MRRVAVLMVIALALTACGSDSKSDGDGGSGNTIVIRLPDSVDLGPADGFDFKTKTEDFINRSTQVSEAAGMSFTDAECAEPVVSVGETYDCTATGADMAEYLFTVAITKRDAFEIQKIIPASLAS